MMFMFLRRRLKELIIEFYTGCFVNIRHLLVHLGRHWYGQMKLRVKEFLMELKEKNPIVLPVLLFV